MEVELERPVREKEREGEEGGEGGGGGWEREIDATRPSTTRLMVPTPHRPRASRRILRRSRIS